MREVDFLISAIKKRKHFELAADASLHGMKLKNDFVDDEYIEIDEKTAHNLDKALQDAMERKRNERRING